MSIGSEYGVEEMLPYLILPSSKSIIKDFCTIQVEY